MKIVTCAKYLGTHNWTAPREKIGEIVEPGKYQSLLPILNDKWDHFCFRHAERLAHVMLAWVSQIGTEAGRSFQVASIRLRCPHV